MGNAVAAAGRPSRRPLRFKYVGGDPSLDLVNTADWAPHGLANELLIDYAGLTRWAEGAGILAKRDAHGLRQTALDRPRAARAAYERAERLRLVLKRLWSGVAAGERRHRSLSEFNDLIADALERLEVSPAGRPGTARGDGKAARWSWRGWGRSLDSVLWPVVWSAALLLVSPEAPRIRTCAGPSCGWVYVDRSRNRLRRWCQMETCGTREKSRRRHERMLR